MLSTIRAAMSVSLSPSSRAPTNGFGSWRPLSAAAVARSVKTSTHPSNSVAIDPYVFEGDRAAHSVGQNCPAGADETVLYHRPPGETMINSKFGPSTIFRLHCWAVLRRAIYRTVPEHFGTALYRDLYRDF